MRLALLSLTAGCLGLLAGCDLAPPYTPPPMEIPAVFKEAVADHPGVQAFLPAQPADTTPRGPWWETYDDSELSRLEQQIDAGNQTLAAAVAAFDQARAYAREAESGLFPFLGLGGSVTNNKQSIQRPLRSATQPNYYGADTIDAQATYEVDFWGQVRDQVAAGKARAQAAGADLEVLRLSLHIELANDYVALRGLDEQIRLLNHTVDEYGKALALVRTRFKGDIASGVDVAQAETRLNGAKSQVSDVMGRRQLLEHAIATLIGQPAPEFSLAPSPAPVTQPDPPAGLPSTLLERRPDIAGAERRVAAANQLVGVAKTAFYPSISLGALGGLQGGTMNLTSLPLAFWSIGPSVSLPLFEGGLRRAQLDAALADLAAAGAKYRATVLNAFQEVEDNLAQLRWLRQAVLDQDAAVASARRSVDLALTLYRDGAENYLQVVTAQTTELTTEQEALTLHTRRLQASLGLIRAIGGGWTTAALPAEKTL